MIKPQDFENVQAYSGFTPLEVGGHILTIKSVEETKSKAGRDMIVVYFDTDRTDKQPNYFSEQYKNNQKPDKKWPNNAIVRQLVLDAEGNTNRGFKTFIEMVEKSNPGFKVQWGNNFVACFKNKLVGGVFGREEWLDNSGISKFSVKHQHFMTVEDIKRGVDAPKDKLLNPSGNDNGPDIYADITPVDDGGNLPF
ncbi:hypothetical protein CLOBY_27470 [Clostridium saccharobutylicum]|uniref:hypothetical protein n=1 Tax=Clostridium saccharobutylicum TaxID=169679 RepID=UPI000983E788|nr:hypothetical protein [Clostridium saccharobutylicum]AQS10602.1 hypothetical protein CLOBY_27470 [Clostridium saccharobutylicum]MBC2438045.1 hypothetical protein [Clostridium saccharobutylicum]NSB90502.1 hypothetical protein [Clostridium saccharobutylicum]NYC31557.1 hypothetical protein [Clostridium saccharobutylicum]OOM18875.1 hypothetical protein CLSAB_03330 [Clostridium saccharobutylicum]